MLSVQFGAVHNPRGHFLSKLYPTPHRKDIKLRYKSKNGAVKKQRPKSKDFLIMGNLGSFNGILQRLTITA